MDDDVNEYPEWVYRAAKRIMNLDQLGAAMDWSVEGIAAIIFEEISRDGG